MGREAGVDQHQIKEVGTLSKLLGKSLGNKHLDACRGHFIESSQTSAVPISAVLSKLSYYYFVLSFLLVFVFPKALSLMGLTPTVRVAFMTSTSPLPFLRAKDLNSLLEVHLAVTVANPMLSEEMSIGSK